MCGILGIIGREPVSDRLIVGAGRLQNRGHRSTMAATYDGELFHSHGGLAPPLMVFYDFDRGRLPGNSGIVHTRYATSGGHTMEDLRRNIQPVFADRPAIATCSNGDLVNLFMQRKRLINKGFSFHTDVDAKVIQNTLIEGCLRKHIYEARGIRQFTDILFDSVENLHKQLVGAYSTLNLMERGILAFKDPHGIRPLCMAERRNNGEVIEYAFASESSVFNYFGDYHNIRQIKPGEAVFVDRKNLRVYSRQISNEKEAFCFFEYVYFSRPDSKFDDQVVEVVRENLGTILAREYAGMCERIDLVVGLPGTALSTAHQFAEVLNLPIKQAIIKVDNKRSFQETSDAKRKKAIDEKFIFIRDFIKDKRVAVIDDSNVRGTTAKKITARLFDLGAKEVHLFYYCPEIIGPCFYGIDTPDEKKLIAFGKNNRQIRKAMGVTSVNYISMEGLIEGLRVPRERLCLACINREYPTPTAEARERTRARKKDRKKGED